MGLSPSPEGASYSSPLLSNVAKTIKAIQDAKGPEKALSLWKRKLSEDAPRQENKKRRGSNSAKKRGANERKLSDKCGLLNGSGVAKAVKQPCRPQ
jgi:hypothetical protein